MANITAYRTSHNAANLHQTRLQRDWMDATVNRHAYRCYPVSMANTIGWSLSYDKDISFVWDGVLDTTPDHVKVLQGEEFCSTGRANGTISFETGIIFRTAPDVTLISIAPPNYFIDGAQAFTSIISTSFFRETFPCAWMITKPNEVITIPAGTPVATLIPVSLKGLSEIEVDLHSKEDYLRDNPTYHTDRAAYGKKFAEIVTTGKWPGYYRNATDADGNKLGEHEVPTLKLAVNDHTTGEGNE